MIQVFMLIGSLVLIGFAFHCLSSAHAVLAKAEQRIREAQRLMHLVENNRREMRKAMANLPVEDWQLQLVWAAMTAGVALPVMPERVRRAAGLN